MKKHVLVTMAFSLGLTAMAQGIYQFEDPGFESYTSTGSEPGYGWNSFNSATGSVAGLGKGSSPKPELIKPGANGTGRAVQIFSKSILGAKANGNLTTGMINMGSTTPSSASNYNYTKRGDSSHSLLFAGRPDAVTFYAKFVSGGSPNGRGQFILHDGDVDYRDPELAEQAGNRIGKAAALVPVTSEWTKFTAEFTYDKAQTATQYLLATFTTNPTPGGSAGDYLQIDEIQFVYYHSLASISYNGAAITVPEGGTYNLAPQTYDPAKLQYTVKGVGATVETDYDAAMGVLNIKVKGNDYPVNSSSVTTYTLFFALGGTTDPDPEPEPEPTPGSSLGEPVASLADLRNSTTYAIYNATYTAYAIYSASNSTTSVWTAGMTGDAEHPVSNNAFCGDFDITAPEHAWMVIPFNGLYYIYNMGAKKFLRTPGYEGATGPCTFSADPVGLTAEELGNATFALTRTSHQYDYMCASPAQANPICIWENSDIGACWQFKENQKVAADPSVLALIDASLTPDPEPEPDLTQLGEPVSTVDELDMHKTYAIYNPHFTTYAVSNLTQTENLWAAGMTGDAGHNLANEACAQPYDRFSNNGAWMVVNHGGHCYIYNMGAKKFLTLPVDVDGGVPCTLVDEPIALTLTACTENPKHFTLTLSGNEKDFMCAAPQLSGANMLAPICTWTAADDGSQWQIMLNPNVEADIEVLNLIDPVLTGIGTLPEVQQGHSPVYNLSGIRMPQAARLPKGVYIRGGKKIIVK